MLLCAWPRSAIYPALCTHDHTYLQLCTACGMIVGAYLAGIDGSMAQMTDWRGCCTCGQVEGVTLVTLTHHVPLCMRAGQLLVWEWRSETYVLKQQGHFYDVSAVAFSPDGALIATGADDNKARAPALLLLQTAACAISHASCTPPCHEGRHCQQQLFMRPCAVAWDVPCKQAMQQLLVERLAESLQCICASGNALRVLSDCDLYWP